MVDLKSAKYYRKVNKEILKQYRKKLPLRKRFCKWLKSLFHDYHQRRDELIEKELKKRIKRSRNVWKGKVIIPFRKRRLFYKEESAE